MSQKSIGNYLIEQEINRGIDYAIYRAFDPKRGESVVLQVFDSDEQSQAKFLAAARAASELSLPFTVPIIDAGETGGVGYLASAPMEGGTLTERVQYEAPLSDELIQRMVQRMGKTLDALHTHGTLHGNITPAAILFDDYGDPHLGNFGLASIRPDPQYFSPEQRRINATIDARSDLFSFGLVLFEMLTGELPYLQSTGEISPSDKALARIEPSKAHWQPVIDTLLAFDPAERYTSGEELTYAVYQLLADADPEDDYVNDPPPPVYAPPAGEDTQERRPLARILLGALGFLLVLGAVGSWLVFRPSPPEGGGADTIETSVAQTVAAALAAAQESGDEGGGEEPSEDTGTDNSGEVNDSVIVGDIDCRQGENYLYEVTGSPQFDPPAGTDVDTVTGSVTVRYPITVVGYCTLENVTVRAESGGGPQFSAELLSDDFSSADSLAFNETGWVALTFDDPDEMVQVDEQYRLYVPDSDGFLVKLNNAPSLDLFVDGQISQWLVIASEIFATVTQTPEAPATAIAEVTPTPTATRRSPTATPRPVADTPTPRTATNTPMPTPNYRLTQTAEAAQSALTRDAWNTAQTMTAQANQAQQVSAQQTAAAAAAAAATGTAQAAAAQWQASGTATAQAATRTAQNQTPTDTPTTASTGGGNTGGNTGGGNTGGSCTSGQASVTVTALWGTTPQANATIEVRASGGTRTYQTNASGSVSFCSSDIGSWQINATSQTNFGTATTSIFSGGALPSFAFNAGQTTNATVRVALRDSFNIITPAMGQTLDSGLVELEWAASNYPTLGRYHVEWVATNPTYSGQKGAAKTPTFLMLNTGMPNFDTNRVCFNIRITAMDTSENMLGYTGSLSSERFCVQQ